MEKEIKEIKLPSGNTLAMQEADWISVGKLRSYTINSLKEIFAGAIDVKEFSNGDIVKLIAQCPSVVESKLFEEIFFECAKRCLVKKPNGDKENLSPAYFKSRELWKDYYPSIGYILDYNLAPFVYGLIEALPAKAKQILSRILQ